MKFFYITIFTIIFSCAVKAQMPGVYTPTINSSNSWSTIIKTHVAFSSNAGTLGHSFMKDFDNHVIDLTSCYYGPGVLTVITNIRDSINIGFLPVGNYTLNYTVYFSSGTNGCTPYDTTFNTYTFHAGPTSINELELINGIQFAPNPVKDHFKLICSDATFSLAKASIFNSLGQKVQEIIEPKLNSEIDIDLPQGIYSIEIDTGTNVKRLKFLKE